MREGWAASFERAGGGRCRCVLDTDTCNRGSAVRHQQIDISIGSPLKGNLDLGFRLALSFHAKTGMRSANPRMRRMPWWLEPASKQKAGAKGDRVQPYRK
jgi:hypothetical protein